MNSTYVKDVIRTIRHNSKRFLALMAIMALGLTAYTGITAACDDMYRAADRFYDEQRFFDIRVLSTLGLTGEDVEALEAVTGVETADGGYSETVHTVVHDLRQTAEMTMLSAKGVNQPYLTQGRLPERAGEIAVTQDYLDKSGKAVGDLIEIEEELEESKSDDEAVIEPEDSADDGVDWAVDVEIEEEAETPTFPNTVYTITGVVIDPLDVASDVGESNVRTSSATDYTFFVTPDDVKTDVYTSVYLILEGLGELDCYSGDYVSAIQAVIDRIEMEIMKQRQQARYDAVIADALEIIQDAEATMNEQFDEADEKFADARAEIDDARRELSNGETNLSKEESDANKSFDDARAEIEKNHQTLLANQEELTASAARLEAGKAQLTEAKKTLSEQRAATEAQLADGEKQLSDAQAELSASRGPLEGALSSFRAYFGTAWPEREWNAYVNKVASLAASGASDADINSGSTAEAAALQAAFAALDGGKGNLSKDENGEDMQASIVQTPPGGSKPGTAQMMQTGFGLGKVQGGQQALNGELAAFSAQKDAAIEQLNQADAELLKKESELSDGETLLLAGQEQLAQGWAQLADGAEALDLAEAKAFRAIANAWQDIADGKRELNDGVAELNENEEKYLDKKAEAEEKLADAYQELSDIDMAQWYVQDRTANGSYLSLDNDLSSIGAIGKAFPILFLIVAVLISLTTMTRMVEEERGLIGTYKALGFGNWAISLKYLLYALLAALAGSLIGNLLGFIALPKLLLVVFEMLSVIPNVTVHFYAFSGVSGTILFTGSILAATALALKNELKQTPAALMRPKSPAAGSRIFLERVPFIWNRLKFLNKVTARNLFRFKKRLFMTVIGIAGCTALVLAGFAIRDSVTYMMPQQYGHIYRYELMAVADTGDGDYDRLLSRVQNDEEIADYLPAQITNVKVLNDSDVSESAQIIVIPSGAALDEYILTVDLSGARAELTDDGILLTQNAAKMLSVSPGDAITLQTLQLDRYTVTVNAVVENYLGNNVYISQALYENLIDTYEPNLVYAHFSSGASDTVAYAEALLDEAYVSSSASLTTMQEQFSTNFSVLNYVIYLLIILAAGLAFVVLFTLSTTNISERERELATIKVLGFYDREVHAYTNKETMLLALMGIVYGLPLGYIMTGLIFGALQMSGLEFALYAEPLSYLVAALVSFAFVLIVNSMTNRILDRIDMVEALKSVE